MVIHVPLRFVYLCFLSVLMGLAFQHLLISDTLYYNALGNQLSYERIRALIAQGERWKWLGNVLVPVLCGIKLSLVASAMSLGSYLTTNRFHFKHFFGAAIFGELVFLLPLLIKLLWFLFVQTDYTLQDLSMFYPLSLLNIIGTENIPSYWLYPLQTLNLFELAYWFLLAQGVSEATGQSFRQSFGLVMSSYIEGLVLWVVLVMFLTITYS
jgi:hypothetical protein